MVQLAGSKGDTARGSLSAKNVLVASQAIGSTGFFIDLAGMTLTATVEGTYLIYADIFAEINLSGGVDGHISARLFNLTQNVSITGSTTEIVFVEGTGVKRRDSSSIIVQSLLKVGDIVSLQVLRNGAAATFTSSSILQDPAAGETAMGFYLMV